MAKRNFQDWLDTFTDSIASYSYYTDFDKVYKNVDNIKIELNILNSLVGSENIEEDFDKILNKYPEVLECIPILLAVRQGIIPINENGDLYLFDFKIENQSREMYKKFMRETGLFELISKRIINDLVDYVMGVEVGLDSNARKNRTGDCMEDLVESYIVKAGFKKDVNYFKEMYSSDIQKRWGLDLSSLSNEGKVEKRFDFVIKTDNNVFGIETNFYTGSGSKLNETARSYKTLSLEAESINGFTFVWFTDGVGWQSAKNNLEETFDVLETLYNINDLKNGIAEELFI